MRVSRFWSGVLCALVSACGGLSLDESTPGGDTRLETGAVAVDPVTKRSFVMHIVAPGGGGPVVKTLYAVDPVSGPAVNLGDMSRMTDVRILFPANEVLLMGEIAGRDQLRVLDPDTLTERMRSYASVHYNGTRLSHSRRWLRVADNTSDHAPIHVIDTRDLSTEVIPHGGDWLEMMWLNQSDTLAAIVFYGDPLFHDTPPTDTHARILLWSMATVMAQDFALGADGLWLHPEVDVDVPDVTSDSLFSFTWIGVAPDDSKVVFPVHYPLASGDQGCELLVLDLATHELGTVDDARGPVGFTPDSSTIVSYRFRMDAMGSWVPQLLLLDAATLEATPMDIPLEGGPEYFVSHEGNVVVVASPGGNQPLVLYDLDTGEQTSLGGAQIALRDFVSRLGHDELWLVDDGLFRLDFASASLETVPLGFTPAHINILPMHDRLVLSAVDRGDLYFYDPVARGTTRYVPLP